jgi:hypothetical protein
MWDLVDAIASQRRVNDRKAETVRRAFLALLLGLAPIAAEAAILATTSVV